MKRSTILLLLATTAAVYAEEYEVWTGLRGIGGTFEQLFTPANDVLPEAGEFLQDVEFLSGLRGLQDAISAAEIAGKRLRAYGSRYSMNEFAYTEDYLVESWGLNYCKIGIDDDDLVTPAYVPSKDKLVFVQAGVMIKHLHLWLLEKANLALPTSCFPDGPRFVGATLTGSHGSMNQVGSMQDYVKGIHIVIPGGHYFIQKASDPVVTEAYTDQLDGATLINDDALFLAAVVSFGSFGLVHGMLIEVEPSYKLLYESRRYNYEDVKDVISSLDVAPLGLASGPLLPDDFSIYLDPYTANLKGFWARVFTKVPPTEFSSVATRTSTSMVRSETVADATKLRDALMLVARLTRLASKGVKKSVYTVLVGLSLAVGLRSSDSGLAFYPHEWFFLEGSDEATAPVSSFSQQYIETEFFVSSDDALNVTELLLDFVDNDPMATRFGIRYMAPSEATLAPSRFSPLTTSFAIVTIDVIPDTQRLFHEIHALLEESGIPHTFHWGKQMPFTADYVERAYGASLTEWLAQRDAFLGTAGKEMFANQLMEDMGLHVP